ncbi:endonuclease/exonuclease/phosphatase domain-containing protein, putative [Eimeria tenella]|uniref:Endonuclease/exonuclease/phosphatase domain-containing protein, putative n=1 Tax=Eimeria tenella TaxID=5802 RepID=U6L280_EIMTE|nr:endonuclease/exonuclease/phosphatase domain-containing protein, putative [Eimeria tenella]CDJ41875.1 endonuclease/exonuclease/phosphatase domain-containing protein, putative [Eimeria tenella]|eukprot:XP_013232625.1 endonuclease/exonuclease/phosphatase domain-containing protein, putative [Eimeria tenella]
MERQQLQQQLQPQQQQQQQQLAKEVEEVRRISAQRYKQHRQQQQQLLQQQQQHLQQQRQCHSQQQLGASEPHRSPVPEPAQQQQQQQQQQPERQQQLTQLRRNNDPICISSSDSEDSEAAAKSAVGKLKQPNSSRSSSSSSSSSSSTTSSSSSSSGRSKAARPATESPKSSKRSGMKDRSDGGNSTKKLARDGSSSNSGSNSSSKSSNSSSSSDRSNKQVHPDYPTGGEGCSKSETLESSSSGSASSSSSSTATADGLLPDSELPIWRDEFDLLTWNLDGLDERLLRLRTAAVCSIVLQLRPAVVLLQEVVDSSARLLQQRLQQHYSFFFPSPPPYAFPAVDSSSSSEAAAAAAGPVVPGCPYYCAVLLCKHQMLPPAREQLQTLWYPGSSMGRHLLFGCCSSSKRPLEPLLLLTSHLESMRPNRKERTQQLQHCFDLMAAVTAADPQQELQQQQQQQMFADAFPMGKPQKVRTAILAGDLNLRDDELQLQQQQQQQQNGGRFKRAHNECSSSSNTIIPEGAIDAWEFLGRDMRCMHTWDMLRNDNHAEVKRKFKPRCRFDRIYVFADPPLSAAAAAAAAADVPAPPEAEHAKRHKSTSSSSSDVAAAVWQPIKMRLVGTERLQSVGCFPSDHFGVPDCVESAAATAVASAAAAAAALLLPLPVQCKKVFGIARGGKFEAIGDFCFTVPPGSSGALVAETMLQQEGHELLIHSKSAFEEYRQATEAAGVPFGASTDDELTATCKALQNNARVRESLAGVPPEEQTKTGAPAFFELNLAIDSNMDGREVTAWITRCGEGQTLNAAYSVTFLNPGGFFTRQFSCEDQGLLQLHMVMSLFATALCLASYRVYRQLHRQASPVAAAATCCCCMLGLSILLQTLHLIAYAVLSVVAVGVAASAVVNFLGAGASSMDLNPSAIYTTVWALPLHIVTGVVAVLLMVFSLLNADAATQMPQRRLFVRLCFWGTSYVLAPLFLICFLSNYPLMQAYVLITVEFVCLFTLQRIACRGLQQKGTQMGEVKSPLPAADLPYTDI